MVATTTNMHKDTGTKSLMTCFAPYFSSSSSSSGHSVMSDGLPVAGPLVWALGGTLLNSPFSWC
jgi:hypothetical protein